MSTILNGDYYNTNANLFQRFGYHAILGLKKNIGSREGCEKNLLEKIGDAGLWIVEDFPRKVWRCCKDPRVVTIAITALALIAASFLFYPSLSWIVAKAAIKLIPIPSLGILKFIAYLFTNMLIVAGACRAEGRFVNSALMNKFYSPREVGAHG